MLTVRDIMTPDPFTLDFTAGADEAAWALTRRHIGGAPVVDAEGNVVGMLSAADLVNPAPRDWISGEGTVGDRMAPQLFALYASDPAQAAARMMAQRQVHRVLVLDDEARVVGIVTTFDIARAVAEGSSFAVEGNEAAPGEDEKVEAVEESQIVSDRA